MMSDTDKSAAGTDPYELPPIDWARRYHALGYTPVPLYTIDQCMSGWRHKSPCPEKSHGKHPLINWRGIRHITVAHINTWWGDHPDAGIALLTGARSGFDVIDIDPDNGGDYQLLTDTYQGIPDQPHTISGSGGQHVWVTHPGVPTTNGMAQTIGLPGIDYRGDGGLIVVAPTIHYTGNRYRFTSLPPPAPVTLPWLETMARKKDTDRKARQKAAEQRLQYLRDNPPEPPTEAKTRTGANMLAVAVEKILESGANAGRAGGRHDTVIAQARWIGGLIPEGYVTEDDVRRDLLDAAVTVAGPEREAEMVEAISWGIGEGVGAPWVPEETPLEATRPNLVTVNPPGQTQPDTPESDADVRMVQPPSNPYPNAAQYVSDRHTNDGHTLLAHHGGDWHHWTGTCWPPLSDTTLDNSLYDYFNDAVYETDKGIKPFQPARSKVADLVHAMRAVCPVDETVVAPAWLDGRTTPPASEIIACRNGLLHWPTRTLTPHDPTFWTHHSVPFDYDPHAPTPTAWCAFLNDLWGDDGQSIDCLQEMFGYLLSGDTSLQKLFAVVGPKRSGKGTIARVLTALIGHANVTGPSLSAFAQQFGLQPLVGKPVAIIADARLRQGDDLVNTRLLSISGEDMLTVDRKYRDHWHGTLSTRIVILSNDLPNLPDPSGSLASRFVLLMTLKSFYGREDQGLTNRLLVELPGILNWSLDGLERLRHRGRFVVPESSSEAMREMEDLGSPISAFIRDRCEVEPGVSISVDQLYKAWVAWCGENGRDHPGTQQRFGRDLRSAVPGLVVRQRTVSGARVRTYEGIRLSFSMEVPL